MRNPPVRATRWRSFQPARRDHVRLRPAPNARTRSIPATLSTADMDSCTISNAKNALPVANAVAPTTIGDGADGAVALPDAVAARRQNAKTTTTNATTVRALATSWGTEATNPF